MYRMSMLGLVVGGLAGVDRNRTIRIAIVHDLGITLSTTDDLDTYS